MKSPGPSETNHLIGRLSAAFLLDTIELTRGDDNRLDDLLDNLIVVAVLQVNVAPVVRDPDLQRAYAAYEAPPPDELRRARTVSINAIATSLRLSPETVRRRVAQMTRQGRCVITPTGVYVPQAAVSTPGHMAGALANYELVWRLYRRLRDLQILPAPSGQPTPGEAPPVRAVMRLLSDYFLRAVDSVRDGPGDIISTMIILGMLRANTEHLPDRPKVAPEEASDFIADAERRPVSAVALAARLRLPRETVRRNLARLVAEGECRRTPRGLIVPSDVLQRPGGVLFGPGNLANLQRMFAALDDLGVLARWERERP